MQHWLAMGCLEGIAVFFFNLILVLCTLPIYLLAKASNLAATCKPYRAHSCRRRTVLAMTCLAWRLVLILCCWVRTEIDGLDEFRSTCGTTGRSAVLVANHTSFLDTILLVTFMPLAKIVKVKMFVSSHLMKMPFLGPITVAMGHLAVPFKAKSAEGTFELDKDLMAVRQKELEEHVAAGGIAGWYPEGTINRDDTREVKTFRAGGFALAAHLDVEIWCVAFQGNAICWPGSASLGGRPARIGAKIFKLCDSSHSFIAAGNVNPSDEREASIRLANCAHDQTQSHVSQLVEIGRAHV